MLPIPHALHIMQRIQYSWYIKTQTYSFNIVHFHFSDVSRRFLLKLLKLTQSYTGLITKMLWWRLPILRVTSDNFPHTSGVNMLISKILCLPHWDGSIFQKLVINKNAYSLLISRSSIYILTGANKIKYRICTFAFFPCQIPLYKRYIVYETNFVFLKRLIYDQTYFTKDTFTEDPFNNRHIQHETG